MSDDVGRRDFVRVLGALGAGALATETVAATPGRQPEAGRDELLVGVADDAEMSEVESQAVSTAAATARGRGRGRGQPSVTHRNETLEYFAVELPEQASDRAREAIREAMERRPGVDYAEENVTVETMEAPNDPQYDTQYAPQQVNAESAWDTTFGDTDVTVAVIDTGAAYGHEDLDALYRDDPGYDFVSEDGDPYPDSGAEHGTHVSGCASADTDNGVGVAGVTDATIINARTLGGSGGGSLSDVADGVQWAADQGADIINMSLGGGGYTQTMKNAVQYAYDQNDVLILCAAGNSSTSPVSYPARYEECVAVSALDPNEDLANFSNYGADVEVGAPGVNVLSTVPGDGYAEFSGTSMASPVAAGVAALGAAAYPDLSASELRQRLKDTAADVGLPSDEQGSGRVDAATIVEGGDGGDGDDGDGGDGDDGDGGDGDDGDGGDGCGDTISGQATGTLEGWWDEDSYYWPVQHDDPCELTVELTGDGYDFDLYAGGESSRSRDSTESITLSDISADQQIDITVESYWGDGDYTLTVTETGAASVGTADDCDDPLQEEED